MRSLDEIIVHCSATKAGRNVGAKEIDRWHKARGFKCIGYHFVVKLDGTIEAGRSISEIGAHCKGKNSHSIGIVYVGGIDENGKPADTRTNVQKVALRALLQTLCILYPSIIKIAGHRNYAAKACPCFDASFEYMDITKPRR